MRLLIASFLICLLILGASACRKNQEAKDTSLDPGPPGTSLPDGEERIDEGFTPEPPVAPLLASPLTLDGMALGSVVSEVRAHYDGPGAKLDEFWYEEGLTGMLQATIEGVNAGEGKHKELVYMESGEMVGFQKLLEQDRNAFVARSNELTVVFGEPVDEPPCFLKESGFYQFMKKDNMAEIKIWADEPTRTAIVGTLSADEKHAMWIVLHPERYDAAEGDTYAAMGS